MPTTSFATVKSSVRGRGDLIFIGSLGGAVGGGLVGEGGVIDDGVIWEVGIVGSGGRLTGTY